MEQFSLLSDEEFGHLIRSAISYERDGVLPDFPEKHLSLSFSVLKSTIDRDREKYEKVCERNRISANKRWNKEECF